MPRVLPTLAAGAAVALAYGTMVEPKSFALRRFDVPILPPGSRPIRVLHLSDTHLTPRQRRKQSWIRQLAGLRADLVINTGDTLSAPNGIPAVMHSFEPLFTTPGVFVPGNNDYYEPRPKNPVRYFFPTYNRVHGPSLPWPEMAKAMTDAGWIDLTNRRTLLEICGLTFALAGTDDPHLGRARYGLIAGRVAADVRIGVTHSPEPSLLQCFADDGYDLVLAGHTHGGQVRVPFGPAIVTNCGIDVWRARWLHRWDERMYFHVSAGLGSSPWAPIRFASRPEATLLTLIPRS